MVARRGGSVACGRGHILPGVIPRAAQSAVGAGGQPASRPSHCSALERAAQPNLDRLPPLHMQRIALTLRSWLLEMSEKVVSER
jgi:hypothetical protein